MNLTFETEQEADGRWLAEVPELAGVMAYGATESEAVAKAEALALRALAERLENAEAGPINVRITVAAERANSPRRKQSVLSPHWCE